MKEGIEALGEEVRTKSVPSSRSSSKRTRAAEVLNLSEKVCDFFVDGYLLTCVWFYTC